MRRSYFLLAAALVLVPVAALDAGASARVAPPVTGLVLHYPMETLTQATVDDASPNGLDGHVVVGTGTVRLVAGLAGYGKAIQLTGTQHQYVDVPTSAVLDVDRYTLAAWVRYTGIENDQTLGRWEVLEKAGAYWMNIRTNGLLRVGGFYGGCANPSWKYFDSTARAARRPLEARGDDVRRRLAAHLHRRRGRRVDAGHRPHLRQW